MGRVKILGLDNMIEIIVKEVVKRVTNEMKLQRKQALVIFTGAMAGYKDALHSLKEMSADGYNFKVVLSKSAQKILDQDKIKEELKVSDIYVEENPKDIDYLKKDIDKIVISTLTRNSAAKVATGIADTLPTYLISWGIMAGIPIVASEEGCNPKNSNSRHYQNMLVNNLNILKEYGISLRKAKDIYKDKFKEFTNSIEYEKEMFMEKKLITREDVIEAKNSNKKILVSKNTIVTQLAKDIAREIGVTIKTTN